MDAMQSSSVLLQLVKTKEIDINKNNKFFSKMFHLLDFKCYVKELIYVLFSTIKRRRRNYKNCCLTN
ncbi:MAG: hypothetical protein ACI9OE_002253 [Mariniflexile sp.]|jgi:hypothetical protein